ncbi:LysR family transcriptional regulator [Pseudomonas sp. RW10S2]|uniref:LysR family transcriptional regulator n=1 Tax=Pseudomonas sp. RW10S2 TaxID=459637 RepID=UPI0016470491|nr:LysR family transcriptional regulator [Pseudomonas sp. RW10S2]MBC3466845.1 LysR family transcriptional regulator [Pseudomonas sp. RW10S2]
MELRHLRCFVAVAEELHFGRAAERLHVDQSPLSRTIKELEEELGTALFVRTTRSTRLTRAGRLFLDHVPRVFTALEQARSSVRAAAAGYDGQLRIALSDGITPPRLSSLMAQCRQEDPEIAIHFSEVSLAQQVRGLHDDLYDVGFAQSDHAGDGILVEPAWSDPLRVAIPARHPLLAHARIPLDELMRYPLVMCDARLFEGYQQQIERVLRSIQAEPLIAERVSSFDLMMAMVSAGFALALVGASQIGASRAPDIVGRPLAGPVGPNAMLTTYVLRRDADPTDAVSRFIERVASLESEPASPVPANSSEPDKEASL